MDPECVELCRALNALPGIMTFESCCGHGERPFHVWFLSDNLEALPSPLYWFMVCHCGFPGWQVVVTTDCGRSPVHFRIDGPPGAYDQARAIAALIAEDAVRDGAEAAEENEEAPSALVATPLSDDEVSGLSAYLSIAETAPGSGVGHLWPWGVPENDALVRRLVATIEHRRRFLVFEMEHYENAGPTIPLLGYGDDLAQAKAMCRLPLARYSYEILDMRTGAVHSLGSDGVWTTR
jgi:hypothetical protein